VVGRCVLVSYFVGLAVFAGCWSLGRGLEVQSKCGIVVCEESARVAKSSFPSFSAVSYTDFVAVIGFSLLAGSRYPLPLLAIYLIWPPRECDRDRIS
jgi:hypothetical protein